MKELWRAVKGNNVCGFTVMRGAVVGAAPMIYTRVMAKAVDAAIDGLERNGWAVEQVKEENTQNG